MGEEPPQRSNRRIALHGVAGAVLAVAANLAVLSTGRAVTGLPPPYRLGAPGPVVVPVAAAVGATALYSVLTRRSVRPFDPFARLMATGLVVSLGPIAVATTIYGIDWISSATLLAMHVAVALVLVGVFSPRTGLG